MASAVFEGIQETSSFEKCLQDSSKEDRKTNSEDVSHDEGAGIGRSGLGSKHWDLVKESYKAQLQIWPTIGRHILAHFDDESIVVYQAFKGPIAEYAVTHQRFGGPDYSFTRMSWIKTNFLWMMFRCGWAKKHNQEHVLAIRISRDGFEQILSKAYLVGKAPPACEHITNKVRLQWDPDHQPDGSHERRRAIQLGLRGQILEDFCTKFIINIKDISDFVREQQSRWQKDGPKALITPRERVYVPNAKVHAQIELDFVPEQTVVSFSA